MISNSIEAEDVSMENGYGYANSQRDTQRGALPGILQRDDEGKDDFVYINGIGCDDEAFRDYFSDVDEDSMRRFLTQLKVNATVNIEHEGGVIGKVTNARYTPNKGTTVDVCLHSTRQLEKRNPETGEVENRQFVEWAKRKKQEVKSGKYGQFSLEFSQPVNQAKPSLRRVTPIAVALVEEGFRPVGDFAVMCWSSSKGKKDFF